MPAFMREIILELAGREIKYPDLDIEFEVNFKDDSEGNTGHIEIFNLASPTIDIFEQGLEFTLKAGYENDVGVVLPGIIEKHQTRHDEVDKITELIIGDHTTAWLNATINRTWSEGKDAHRIAQDIIDLLPFDLGDFSPANNVTYEKGKTFSTTCKTALEELAGDIGAKIHLARGQIFFREPEKGSENIVNLNSNTGLISTPERGEKDGKVIWDVRSLLNYRIWSDEVVKINSKSINGLYRVRDGRHFRSGDDFLTEMEVEEYGT